MYIFVCLRHFRGFNSPEEKMGGLNSLSTGGTTETATYRAGCQLSCALLGQNV